MTKSLPETRQNAYISYGVMEGSLHGTRMRQALRKRGYRITSEASDADVIVAHSGGYFLLPELGPRTKLLLIDPAGYTGRSPAANIIRHVFFDIKQVFFSRDILFYLRKTLLNLLYFCVQVPRNTAMYRIYRAGGRPELLKRTNTVIVQGHDRSWLDKDGFSSTETHYLRTTHDDCWRNPERYLAFLDH